LSYQSQKVSRFYLPYLFPCPWADEREKFISAIGAHEGVGYGHRKVEIDQFGGIIFHSDELFDIRVIYAEDTHIGTPPCAALFYHLCGHVEDPDKGDRATCLSHGRGDDIVFRPETGEREPCTSAGLMDLCCLFQPIEDGIE
jgi:hypothetical protein